MGRDDDIARVLISEVGLKDEQAKVFVFVVRNGAAGASDISRELEISEDAALSAAKRLVELGAFIDYDGNRFESMHPRFSAVNMYRRACKEQGKEAQQNFAIDNVGSALERDYDRARTNIASKDRDIS